MQLRLTTLICPLRDRDLERHMTASLSNTWAEPWQMLVSASLPCLAVQLQLVARHGPLSIQARVLEAGRTPHLCMSTAHGHSTGASFPLPRSPWKPLWAARHVFVLGHVLAHLRQWPLRT